MWKIEYTQEAIKQLKKLPKGDAAHILKKIEELGSLDSPSQYPQVKFLVGELKGYLRLRVSNIRVIFKLNLAQKLIIIFTVLHRKDAYR